MIDMKTGDVHLDKGLVIKWKMSKKEFVEAFREELFDVYKKNSMEKTTFGFLPRVVDGVPVVVVVNYTSGDKNANRIEIYHENHLYLYDEPGKANYVEMCEMLETIVRRDFATSTRFHTWGSCEYGRNPREGTASIVLRYY